MVVVVAFGVGVCCGVIFVVCFGLCVGGGYGGGGAKWWWQWWWWLLGTLVSHNCNSWQHNVQLKPNHALAFCLSVAAKNPMP